MLILTRRIDESLFIDEKTKVTFLGLRGNEILIGITAPDDIRIHGDGIDFIGIDEENPETST